MFSTILRIIQYQEYGQYFTFNLNTTNSVGFALTITGNQQTSVGTTELTNIVVDTLDVRSSAIKQFSFLILIYWPTDFGGQSLRYRRENSKFDWYPSGNTNTRYCQYIPITLFLTGSSRSYAKNP